MSEPTKKITLSQARDMALQTAQKAEQARQECRDRDYRESPQYEIDQLTAEVEQLRADALRWRYVRDRLAYINFGLDEECWFRFYEPKPPGRSITEVIDKLIAAEREGEA